MLENSRATGTARSIAYSRDEMKRPRLHDESFHFAWVALVFRYIKKEKPAYLSDLIKLCIPVVVVIVVYLTLTDPLRTQPWPQDRRNRTKSNKIKPETRSEKSGESRQKTTDKKVASKKGHRRHGRTQKKQKIKSKSTKNTNTNKSTNRRNRQKTTT